MKNVLYSLLGVVAGFILAGALLFVSRLPQGEAIVLQPAPTKAPIAVHVLGGVARPGLYYLPEGARAQDAIDAAGGLITAADTGTLNLAQKVEDGQQLNIPCRNNACPVGEEPGLQLPNADENSLPPELQSPALGASPDGLIDVNSATLEELDSLPGIGPVTAQKIIEYREMNGCFYLPEDLLNVSGIGPATLENIRDKITTDYCQ